MAGIYDVGQYITELVPEIDKMRLYKLCFFSQGWSLAWTGAPLFTEDFQAWSKGPVPATLRQQTEPVAVGMQVPLVPGGSSSSLSVAEKQIIKEVVDFYSGKTSLELSALSHGKAWKEARGKLPDGARCTATLDVAAIRDEFLEALHSDAAMPAAPMETLVPEDFSLAALRESASRVEAAWHDTFALLAKR